MSKLKQTREDADKCVQILADVVGETEKWRQGFLVEDADMP
jgi:hypothetical protein